MSVEPDAVSQTLRPHTFQLTPSSVLDCRALSNKSAASLYASRPRLRAAALASLGRIRTEASVESWWACIVLAVEAPVTHSLQLVVHAHGCMGGEEGDNTSATEVCDSCIRYDETRGPKVPCGIVAIAEVTPRWKDNVNGSPLSWRSDIALSFNVQRTQPAAGAPGAVGHRHFAANGGHALLRVHRRLCRLPVRRRVDVRGETSREAGLLVPSSRPPRPPGHDEAPHEGCEGCNHDGGARRVLNSEAGRRLQVERRCESIR